MRKLRAMPVTCITYGKVSIVLDVKTVSGRVPEAGAGRAAPRFWARLLNPKP